MKVISVKTLIGGYMNTWYRYLGTVSIVMLPCVASKHKDPVLFSCIKLDSTNGDKSRPTVYYDVLG